MPDEIPVLEMQFPERCEDFLLAEPEDLALRADFGQVFVLAQDTSLPHASLNGVYRRPDLEDRVLQLHPHQLARPVFPVGELRVEVHEESYDLKVVVQLGLLASIVRQVFVGARDARVEIGSREA